MVGIVFVFVFVLGSSIGILAGWLSFRAAFKNLEYEYRMTKIGVRNLEQKYIDGIEGNTGKALARMYCNRIKGYVYDGLDSIFYD